MVDRKAALIRVDKRFLAELMRLPKNVEVSRVVEPIDRPSAVDMVIVGDGLPERFAVSPGGKIPFADPVVTVGDGGVFSWSFLQLEV